jgi:antirestriction protein
MRKINERMIKMDMKIFVSNLSAYNNGKVVGEWIELPLDEDELQEKIDAILESWNDGISLSEEFAIHDYELPFKVSENEDVFKINEKCEKLSNVDHLDEWLVEAILENFHDSDEAFEIIENEEFRIYNNCSDMSEVAYQVYDENGMLAEIEKVLSSFYVDWDAIGRDMEIEGTFIQAGRNYIEILK